MNLNIITRHKLGILSRMKAENGECTCSLHYSLDASLRVTYLLPPCEYVAKRKNSTHNENLKNLRHPSRALV